MKVISQTPDKLYIRKLAFSASEGRF